MARLVFMGADGIARVDKVSPFKAQVECLDGHHPVTNKCFMRSHDRTGPAVILVWQGREAPEGENNMDVVRDAILAENDFTKVHKQKPSVSKLWVRRLVKYANLFACFLLVGFGVGIWGLLAYALVLVMTR